MRYPLPWFPLLDGPSRCSCRTTTNCRPYQSYRAGCRFSRSGSSGFAGGFVVGIGEGMTQRVGENKLFKYTIRRQYNT